MYRFNVSGATAGALDGGMPHTQVIFVHFIQALLSFIDHLCTIDLTLHINLSSHYEVFHMTAELERNRKNYVWEEQRSGEIEVCYVRSSPNANVVMMEA